MRGGATPTTKIRTIPLTKQANYELVWDLAGDMAARTSRTAEACWHQIIAAYWIGNLSTELFCFTRPKGSGAPGRALFALPSRDVLAEHLLGHERAINTSALAELSGWGLNDYQKHEPFRFYVARDPRFGLALRRTDFDVGTNEAVNCRNTLRGLVAPSRRNARRSRNSSRKITRASCRRTLLTKRLLELCATEALK